MGKANRVLLMLIAMVVIMITAVGINRAVEQRSTKQWAKERRERYEEARAEVAEIQMTISELSQDPQALEEFIKENQQYFEDGMNVGEGSIGEEAGSEKDQKENQYRESDVSENDISGNTVSGNDISGNDVSGNDISGNSVSGNTISGNSISGNSVSENTVTGNDISGNGISANNLAKESGRSDDGSSVSGNTLLEKRKIRGSYQETILQKERNMEVIEARKVDFSHKKIVCLGDSITAAANLENMEDYQRYSYPFYLKELLNAESVENLGIGGSSIGRYWENAFVDRYQEIPEDADIILVMGGTNDGFCVSQKDFGIMEERKEGTFIGDLDELMRGLKKSYPDAQIVFATPLPNVLHDMLRKERDYLLPQSMIVNVMKELGREYGIPVIDLYNSNVLDSHDAAVIYNYMPDGVHCNPEGYQVLAQQIAAELVRICEMQEEDIEEEL